MRIHIDLDADLIRRVDERAGPRGRTAFVRGAIEGELARAARQDSLEQAMGSVSDGGHDWDDDPAAWVAGQRSADRSRVG